MSSDPVAGSPLHRSCAAVELDADGGYDSVTRFIEVQCENRLNEPETVSDSLSMANAFRGKTPGVDISRPSDLAHHTVILPIHRHIQSTPYSCGPASLKVVLDTLGLTVDEHTLMAICGTTAIKGTQPAGLSRALDHLNVHHEIHERGEVSLIETKIRNLHYCIVDYQAWGRRGSDFRNLKSGHYSVIFGFDRTHFFFADPAKKPTGNRKTWGVRTIRQDLFDSRWKDREPCGKFTHRWMMSIPLSQLHL